MTLTFKHTLVAAGFATVAAFATSAAQQPDTVYARDLPSKLVAQAKVSESDAAKTASARIPKGHIRGVELEREGGRLIYSYEIKIPGRSGNEEVNVNAKTGAIVNVEHESAAAEAGEAKAEKAKPKKPAL